MEEGLEDEDNDGGGGGRFLDWSERSMTPLDEAADFGQ
jgi:hypothetical protein